MHFNEIHKKIKTFDEIEISVEQWRKNNLNIVFTNGCFDLLHYGHLHYLAAARDLGDRLVVGLNSADSVRRLKGAHRPLNDELTRQHLLAALAFVDAVVVFEEDTPFELIKRIKPHILVKGGDYALHQIVGGGYYFGEWRSSFEPSVHRRLLDNAVGAKNQSPIKNNKRRQKIITLELQSLALRPFLTSYTTEIRIIIMNFTIKKLSLLMQISLFAALFIHLFSCNYFDKTTNNATTTTPQSTIDSSRFAPTEPIDTLNVEKLAKTRIDSNSKVVYLTFDDGPLAPSPYLTDIIHEKQVKMSEFAVGLHALMNKSFMRNLDAMKQIGRAHV